MQLSKEIGVTQKTAWFMLQRIRKACNSNHDDDDNNGFLSGIVEADGVYIGGKESNKHESQKLKAGRGIVGKTAVLKRGFYGIYHSFSTKYLQRYVDEFAYRLNEGNVKIHTWVRLDSLMAKAFLTRITYAELKN